MAGADGAADAPPPILPPFTFPPYATHGIPGAVVRPQLHASASRLTQDATKLLAKDETVTEGFESFEHFKTQVVEVEPGSEEAVELMENAESMAKRFSKEHGGTVISALGKLAKALWKKRQGKCSDELMSILS